MEETQDIKKRILKEIVKKVLSLGESGINKIREMKMLNLKLIERSSKCTKDPNPLATTMWMMNSKYPLAINKDLARKYKIPSEYICPGKQGEDSHKHKLVLAKRDCIEWWINSSPLPSNEEREIIDILLAEGRKQVQTYYNVKWKGSRIKWGQPMLERKIVRTRNPIIEVPPSLREELIKEIMFPDLTIPSSRVTQSLIDKFKNLIHMKIETKMTLSRQIRILLNSMDPAERYIPMLPGLDNTLAPLKHSLCHNNFVLTNYDIETPETDSNLWKDEIENIGKCILREGLAGKLTPSDATELMKKIRINKEPVTKYIESQNLEKGVGSTTLKVLLGKPITLEREHEEVLICPTPAEGTRLDLYNQSNLGLTANTAIELNNFRFGEMRGTFTRSHTAIISISTNFTTLRDLKALLSRIGTYILWNFTNTKGRTIMAVKEEIRRKINERPQDFIDCSLRQWSKISSKNANQIGILTINERQEYMTTGSFFMEFEKDWSLVLRATNQRINLIVSGRDLRPFSELTDCSSEKLLEYFNCKRTIKHLFNTYIQNYDKVKNNIRKKIFTWRNAHMTKFLPKSGNSISQVCRFVCSNIIGNDTYNPSTVCMSYIFCHKDPHNAPVGPTKFSLTDNTIIDLEGNDGIYKYDSKKMIYTLYGVNTAKSCPKLDRGTFMTGLLEGYRLFPAEAMGKKIISVRKLEKDKMNIPEGEERYTYISGNCYKAIRDSSIKAMMNATLNRHMREIIDRHLTGGEQIILGKRSWFQSGDDSDEDDCLPIKKRRIEEEENQDCDSDIDHCIGEDMEGIYDSIDIEILEEDN